MRMIVFGALLAACITFVAPASAIMDITSFKKIKMVEYGFIEEISGFRNFEWGIPLSMLGEVEEGEHKGFYKRKVEKLTVEEINFAIMGEEKINLNSIEYGFQEKGLNKVLLFFSGKSLFKKLVNRLQFFHEEPDTISDSQVCWKLEKGSATIYYFPKSDDGYIMLEKRCP